MEKTRQEAAIENELDNNKEQDRREVRTLKDFELLLVGGGEDSPNW
jgi:hypothetical protein